MDQNLTETQKDLFHVNGINKISGATPDISGTIDIGLFGDCTNVFGDATGVTGNCTGKFGCITNITGELSEDLNGFLCNLSGDITGCIGNATFISGNVDDCNLTQAERDAGVSLASLISP